MNSSTVLAALLALPLLTIVQPSSHAQTRPAEMNVNAEPYGAALNHQMRRTDMKAEAAQILAIAMRNCSREGKFYNPGTPASDTNGCIPAVDKALTATVTKIIECNKKLQIYNGYKCVSIPTGSPTPISQDTTPSKAP